MDMQRTEATVRNRTKRATTVRVGNVEDVVVSVALDADPLEPYEMTVARARQAVVELANRDPVRARPASSPRDPDALFWSWALR
jgi:hypothetical protein